MHFLRKRSNHLDRGIFFLTLGQILFVCSGAVLNIVLARFFFSPSQMGIFGTVISILLFIECVSSSGLAIVIKRSIAGNTAAVKEIFKTGLKKQLKISILCFVLTIILTPLTGRLLNDMMPAKLLAFASFDLFLFGFYRLSNNSLNGLHLFRQQATAIVSYAIGKLLSIISIVALINSDYIVIGALAGNMVSSLVGFIVSHSFYRRYKPKTEIRQNDLSNSCKWKDIFDSSIWFLLFMLNSSVGIWIIDSTCGSESTGFYVAADTVSKAIFMAAFGIRSVIMPQYSRFYAENNFRQSQVVFYKIIIYCVFFALLPAIMISFLAEPIVKLIFSERYINSVIILKILPFGYFFVVIFEILSHILIACNKQWYATKVALLMAVVNVPVMVAAGNNYGGRGIAWTFLITFSFFSVLLLIRVVLLNIGFSFSSKNGHNSSLSQ